MNSKNPLGCIATVVVLLILAIGGWAWAHSTEHTVTIRVERLDDQSTSNGHQYLVFTDRGVYKDSDSWSFLKFNSSDLFASLEQGATYTCKTTGARIPLMSSYRNLLSCTKARG